MLQVVGRLREARAAFASGRRPRSVNARNRGGLGRAAQRLWRLSKWGVEGRLPEPGIIDRFTETFSRFIDSGFGLLAGDVAFLTSTLVAIDITLVGLMWALAGGNDVLAHLIKKILYVGFFALVLNNFKSLADVVFSSFAGLGLKATGAALTADDLMRPGFVAEAGFTASRPLLEQAGKLIGITSFFANFVTIAVLMLAWLIVLIVFFNLVMTGTLASSGLAYLDQ
jgi:P-type conjugative transfer protein TrbL